MVEIGQDNDYIGIKLRVVWAGCLMDKLQS